MMPITNEMTSTVFIKVVATPYLLFAIYAKVKDKIEKKTTVQEKNIIGKNAIIEMKAKMKNIQDKI